ncbi:MAG: hypothetical protein EHM79_17065 [Geobacter sp.]|nr:MAG: hypothetical protein EHM79_17065 [Geobacter sp.]
MKLHGDAIGPLEGVVELDEKYLGGKPRFVQGVTNPRGKDTKKSCVHVAVERQGDFKADVVPGDSYPGLAYRVAKVVSPRPFHDRSTANVQGDRQGICGT